MVDDRALGVDAALARVDAEGVVAGLVEGTLFVSLTAHLDGGRWREEKLTVKYMYCHFFVTEAEPSF